MPVAHPIGSSVIGRLRWLGLAGTILLAVGGYLAGALPGPAPVTRAEALWGTGPGFRIGLCAYLAGLMLLGWAWWRLGAVLRSPDRPPTRWVVLTGALWALPLLVAPPLGSRDIYAYACQGAVWLDGHDPYSVGAGVGGCSWVESVPDLWRETGSPYGPLALVVSAAAVALARLVVAGEQAQLLVAVGGLRLAAVAGAALVAASAPRLARACGVAPAGALWLGLVTPLVAVHVVAGGHNDALVAGLVVAGLAMVATRRPGTGRLGVPLAGVLLGLATAVKITAVAALPFVMLLAAGSHRRYRASGVVAATAVAAFAGLTAATGLGTGWTASLGDTGALVQWTSVPTGLGMAVGYLLWGLGAPGAYEAAVLVARLLGFMALVIVGVALLLRSWRRVGETRTVVTCCGAVLAAMVLLGPVVYPWYAVVPLAVLATTVGRADAQRWLAVATLVLTGLVLPSGLGVAVLTKVPGALLTALAVGLVTWRWLRRRRSEVPAHPDRPRGPRAPVG